MKFRVSRYAGKIISDESKALIMYTAKCTLFISVNTNAGEMAMGYNADFPEYALLSILGFSKNFFATSRCVRLSENASGAGSNVAIAILIATRAKKIRISDFFI